MRLLVTRPLPDAGRTAAALRGRGHEVLVASLLRVETIENVNLGPGPWSAVVITSANALPAIAAHPRRGEILKLPVMAVGRRTAASASAAGFDRVITAGGSVRELVVHLRQSSIPGRDPLLYLAGQDRSHDLAAELMPQGCAVHTVVVYRADKLAEFPSVVSAALAAAQLDGVLHFSRRSAEAYLEGARAAGLLETALRPAHYCLSGRIAEPLAAAGAASIHVAASPEEAALIALIDAGA